MIATHDTSQTDHGDLLNGSRAELLAALASSEDALSSAEAAQRLMKYGPNEPAQPHQHAGLTQLGLFLLNPLVVILLVASLITALLGDLLDASVIATLVLLSVILNRS